MNTFGFVPDEVVLEIDAVFVVHTQNQSEFVKLYEEVFDFFFYLFDLAALVIGLRTLV